MSRGALRCVILAATGQDINNCQACQCCQIDDDLLARFDVPVWQVFADARENSSAALTNQTIWVLAGAQPEQVWCANGLNAVAIARVLCQEAQLRGLVPKSTTG